MTLQVVERRLEEFGVVLEAMEWGRTGKIHGLIAREGLGFKRTVEKVMQFPRVGNERSIKSVKKGPTPGEKI